MIHYTIRLFIDIYSPNIVGVLLLGTVLVNQNRKGWRNCSKNKFRGNNSSNGCDNWIRRKKQASGKFRAEGFLTVNIKLVL